jgi:acyl-CoA reductase-like NAD-dependent aldehyde dehydrogenase
MADTPIPLRIGADRVTTDDVLDVTSPYDGALVGRVCRGDQDDLDAAVAAARAAMADPLPTHRRAAILDEAARLLADDADRFADTIAREAAKPMGTARGEVTRGVDTLRFSAAAARTFAGEVVPMDASSAGEGKVGFTRRVPAGVVAAITPFNFPLNLVLHKLAPSIAAGCAVVLKPASATPLSAHLVVDLLVEAGLPAGWINVVPCPGSTAMHLVEHDDVAVVSFTGSREVGWRIREAAPRKAVGLELGNTSPLVVAPDADLEDVAARVKGAGFKHAGQSCISTQRLIVHADVADDFAKRLVEQVASLKVGDPLDEDTDVSQLIDEGERDRVVSWVDEATAAGARVLAGGEVVGGLLQPTVLADVDQDMTVCREEVFGPVVTIQTYRDLDDALALANDTPYGLQAAIFTADVGAALRAAEVLDFGGVMINEVPTWRADHMPYGGLRDSGNTREGPLWALRELLTHERLVVMQAPGA